MSSVVSTFLFGRQTGAQGECSRVIGEFMGSTLLSCALRRLEWRDVCDFWDT